MIIKLPILHKKRVHKVLKDKKNLKKREQKSKNSRHPVGDMFKGIQITC